MSTGIDIDALASHVQDGTSFHFPGGLHWEIPEFLTSICITKYVLLEFAVAAVMCAIFIPFVAKVKGGKQVKGRFWNLIETFLVYLKDVVIVPSIGKKHAGPYIPYLWTLFFFVLFCNLAGMLPWSGSPTGSFSVTLVLASFTFLLVLAKGMLVHGAAGYWLGLVPPMQLHPLMAVFLKPLMFAIEVGGLFIKHGVLAIRLMGNMFAGHLTLAVFMAFIPLASGVIYLWIPITFGCVAASAALSVLELFIAFLQAYIFTFLSALFIGMSIHQH